MSFVFGLEARGAVGAAEPLPRGNATGQGSLALKALSQPLCRFLRFSSGNEARLARNPARPGPQGTRPKKTDNVRVHAFCGIKNKAGELVGLSTEKDITTVGSTEPSANAVPSYHASVPAGTHTFYVRYESKKNPSIAYIWTDTIIVSPNQTIKKNIALIDIIEYAPAAPTDFKASYYNVDPTGEFCYVNFTWTDNSVNERGFMIDLKAIQPSEDDANISSDMAASWESLTQYGGAVVGSFTSSGYEVNGVDTKKFDDVPGLCVDGSLNKNQGGSATFKLSRKIRYLARISAVGYGNAGNSDYCYVSFSAGGTGKDGYTPFAADARYIKVGE